MSFCHIQNLRICPISQFKKQNSDTGSTEVQVALLSQRISDLTVHLRTHKHDYASRRGLKKLVGQRKRLLKYLNKTDVTRYLNLCKSLGLRP